MTVRFVEPTSDPKWDDRISQLPGWTLFHTSAWAKVLQQTYGFRSYYAVAEERGAVRGILPVMEADGWPKGRRGISLPFTDECKPISFEPETGRGLMSAVLNEGRRREWKYFEVRGGVELLEGARPSCSFYGHHLNLAASEEELFSRCDPPVQRAIRKAERSGVAVEATTSSEGMSAFIRLNEMTRRRHGVPPQPRAFFENTQREILARDLGFLVIARVSEQPVAASLFLKAGASAAYKFGASDERFQHVRGNNAVMWEGIRHLKNDGAVTLEFGRTSMENEGLRRFKLGWGTTETTIHYCQYDFGAGSYVKTRDLASGWHTRLFRLLPRAAGERVGAWVYSRLA